MACEASLASLGSAPRRVAHHASVWAWLTAAIRRIEPRPCEFFWGMIRRIGRKWPDAVLFSGPLSSIPSINVLYGPKGRVCDSGIFYRHVSDA